MSFALERWGDKAIVVNMRTGHHMTKDPISLQRAEPNLKRANNMESKKTKSESDTAFIEKMAKEHFTVEPEVKSYKVVDKEHFKVGAESKTSKSKLIKAITMWYHKNADEDQLGGDSVRAEIFPEKINSMIQDYRPDGLIRGEEVLNKNITIDYYPGSSPAGPHRVRWSN